MVTVNKYLYEDDFKQKICPCSDKQEYKVLFREVVETEMKTSEMDAVTKASVLKTEKLAVMCTECKNIYFISLTFEGSFKSQFVYLESVEIFDDTPIEARNLLNRLYANYGDDTLVDVATDDYVIKVLSKSSDSEKTTTRYVYLNREDETLYADLQKED